MLNNYKDIIRKQIKTKYKTIDNFAKAINVPRTSINYVLKNGIESSNYAMIDKIFKALNIFHISDIPIVLESSLLELIDGYYQLDDMGKHTVDVVLKTDLQRVQSNSTIAAYNNISDSKQFTHDKKLIMELIEKIKEGKRDF